MSDKKLKTVIEVVDKYSKELKDFSKKINETNDELKKLQDNFGKGSDGAGCIINGVDRRNFY